MGKSRRSKGEYSGAQERTTQRHSSQNEPTSTPFAGEVRTYEQSLTFEDHEKAELTQEEQPRNVLSLTSEGRPKLFSPSNAKSPAPPGFPLAARQTMIKTA